MDAQMVPLEKRLVSAQSVHVDEFQEILNRFEIEGLKQSYITWLLEWSVFNCSTGY